jgi:DNA-binding MarR family transcriptional regulator
MDINNIKVTDLLSVVSGRLSYGISRVINKRFKDASIVLTTDQWMVMAILWDRDRQYQNDIAKQTHKDKASITRIINTLEAQDFVERDFDGYDGRKRIIRLTLKGMKIQEISTKIVTQCFEEAIAGIDSDDLLYVKAILNKILINIEKL